MCRGLPLAPELQPARSRQLSSGAEGLRPARSAGGAWGHPDAHLPSAARGREGAARWVGFSLPEMDFLPPERSGLACRRLPRFAQLLHTPHPLLSALGPKYFSAAVACPPLGIPAQPCPAGTAPGLRPPCRSRPGELPHCLYFHGSWAFLNLCLRGKWWCAGYLEG